MQFNNKSLLILGGNPETRVLVDIANKMGIYTIVVDPNALNDASRIYMPLLCLSALERSRAPLAVI